MYLELKLVMTIERIPPSQYPKVEYGRRCMAFGVDFVGAWFVSSILGSGSLGSQIAQILVFIFMWLILRVVIPYNNKGQSLGRYAFDVKLLEVEHPKMPTLETILKREGILGLESLGLAVALSNILNPTALVLMIPLAIDCSGALSDTKRQQTFHDQYTRTIIVSSRRGYSLDIKVKRLFENFRRNMIK